MLNPSLSSLPTTVLRCIYSNGATCMLALVLIPNALLEVVEMSDMLNLIQLKATSSRALLPSQI